MNNGLGGGLGGYGNGVNQYDAGNDDDTFAKTSVGWVRILSRCFNAAANMVDSKLAADVIGASAAYPGFLEACCSLMNIMPMIPNATQHNLHAVLLKFGSYNRELSLSLIRILLWGTTPQVYRVSNESICDLLFELVTTRGPYTMDKVQVLLEWVVKLRLNYSNRTLRCNNPQSGFIKCIASILWTVHDEQLMTQLHELITQPLFEACVFWIEVLEKDEPLKISFDSLLCALCYVKPELFNQLLLKVDVQLQSAERLDDEIIMTTAGIADNTAITDDNKGISGSEWFALVGADNLSTLLRQPTYLTTLAMACQSPLAVYQLVDSGLPKLLAHALYEYCWSLMPDTHFSLESQNAHPVELQLPTTSATAAVGLLTAGSSCLTDADKAAEHSTCTTAPPPLLSCAHVPKILDFFSECCAEGLMRDWLGTQQGAIFWKPLLELLCNYRPTDTCLVDNEPQQQAFVRLERATINFFSRVTTCHPKNQDTLTTLLIDVIRKPASQVGGNSKPTICGFTRQIVLQLLLENERILVSVRSKQPLQRKDCVTGHTTGSSLAGCGILLAAPTPSTAPTTIANSIPLALVNHHPSKRVNAHHLLFYVSANTKCQEILQNCISETRATEAEAAASATANATSRVSAPTMTSSAMATNKMSLSENKSETEKTGITTTPTPLATEGYNNMSGITFNFNCMDNGMEFLSVAAGVTAKDKRIKDAKNQVAASKDKDLFPSFPSK